MTYRFGVVGAGMIAPYHLQAIRDLPNAEPAGIMDHGTGQGRRLAPDLDPAGAADLDAFLARDDIDIVTVATPSGTHRDIAIRAAEAGKHCIVEKPMEIDVARIDAMIDAHRRAGTRLGGIFNSRYAPGPQLLARAARERRFGRLTFAGATGPWWRDQAYYDGSGWKGTWALDGGGALMNQGIHTVDLLQWIVGAPVAEVSGGVATLAHDRIEVEDTAVATLRYESGALGTLACATSMWPGHFRTVTVAGTRGTAVLGDERLLVWRFAEESSEDAAVRERLLALPGAGIGASDPAAGITSEGHRAVFADFLAALDAGRDPAIDGRESRKAVSIIEAIYASARRGGAPVAPP